MIADYLYNTPMPTGAQCVIVLLKQQYGNRSDFTSDIIGKTLAALASAPNVLGCSAPAAVRQFGFSRTRKTTGAYAGSASESNFEVPTTATFTMTRDGRMQAIAVCIVIGGVIVRGVSMLAQLSVGEATATRLVFSIDDAPYVCKVEGPAFTGKPVGEMTGTVTHVDMTSSPAYVSAPITGNVVHPVPAVQSTDATLIVPIMSANVEVPPMPSQAVPMVSTIDKTTVQADFKAANIGSQYTLSADETVMTKVGAADSSSRCFEVTGRPRPGKQFMRVMFNGTVAGYSCIAISTGLITADNQVAWTVAIPAPNVWHEIKIEEVSAGTYKYSIDGNVLYQGTATRLTFYGHTTVTQISVDTGQLGTALPAGFVWL